MLSALELSMVLRSGANVVVDASRYTALELSMLARAAASGGGQLVLNNTGRLTALELSMIGRAGGRAVTMQLSA